jgi:hypothetical protein
MKRNVFDQPIKPDDYLSEVAKSVAPVPISAGAGVNLAKELAQRAGAQAAGGQDPGTQQSFPGQYQKQALATMGIKTDAVPSGEQRIAALAKDWNKERGVKPTGEFYAGDYSDLTRALRIGNWDAAKQEIKDLLSRKSKEQIEMHFDRLPELGYTHAGPTFERRFRSTLTPEQRDIYRQATTERHRIARDFFRVYRDVLREKTS